MQSDGTRKVEFLEFTFFQFVFYWKISMHFDEQLSFLNTAQRNKPGRERNLIIEAINQRKRNLKVITQWIGKQFF